MLPILYSFKRCPYAMRARIALALAKVSYQIREVDLKNKPQELLAISAKGTVPVLQLDDLVIDESLAVLLYFKSSFAASDIGFFNDYLSSFQQDFVFNLNRFKYHDRYEDSESLEYYQKNLESYLAALNKDLPSFDQLVEIAIYPFLRQAAIANPNWFKQLELNNVAKFMDYWGQKLLEHNIMANHCLWQKNSDLVIVAN